MQPAEEGDTASEDTDGAALPPRCVCVTGATGFIGRHLVAALGAAGHSVRVLCRRPPAARAASAGDPEVVSGSLADEDALERLVAGADVVINCAGAVRGASDAHFDEPNFHGMARLAAVTRRTAPGARFVQLSSLAARAPVLSPYARSKWRAEQYLLTECRALSWVALRPPAVYGPGDTEMLPLFRTMARGWLPVAAPAGSRLSLLYVSDLVALILAVAFAPVPTQCMLEPDDGRAGGYSYDDIGAIAGAVFGRRVRCLPVPAAALRALAIVNLQAARLLGYRPMLTPGKVAELRNSDWVCDNTSLRGLHRWRPQVALEQGIRLTI